MSEVIFIWCSFFFFFRRMHSLFRSILEKKKKKNIDLPTDFSHVSICHVCLFLKSLNNYTFCLAVTCLC